MGPHRCEAFGRPCPTIWEISPAVRRRMNPATANLPGSMGTVQHARRTDYRDRRADYSRKSSWITSPKSVPPKLPREPTFPVSEPAHEKPYRRTSFSGDKRPRESVATPVSYSPSTIASCSATSLCRSATSLTSQRSSGFPNSSNVGPVVRNQAGVRKPRRPPRPFRPIRSRPSGVSA